MKKRGLTEVMTLKEVQFQQTLDYKFMLGDKEVFDIWSKNLQDQAQLYILMIKQGSITLQDKTLKFQYNTIEPRPAKGYSLIFGLHGGGGCPKQVNDQQYQNHLALYNNFLPPGVIWIALRSCEEASDMWWKSYLPDFLNIIIKGFVLNNIVDPNKIFITGYSAGGDGIYNLGPMLADWIAGAAMMAGHPNGVELFNVRNTSFSIQVGGKDEAYDRNSLAKRYIETMQNLSKQYGGFSTKYCHVFQECSHWMCHRDATMLCSFLQQVRNPYPTFILFKQHPRYKKKHFYYIQVDPEEHKDLIIVHQRGNEFHIESDRIPISIYVNRFLVDFSKEVKIYHNKELTVCRKPEKDLKIVAKTIDERMDPDYVFEDCLISVPNQERVPLEFTLADISIEKPKEEIPEPAAIQEQRKQQRAKGGCCIIM